MSLLQPGFPRLFCCSGSSGTVLWYRAAEKLCKTSFSLSLAFPSETWACGFFSCKSTTASTAAHAPKVVDIARKTRMCKEKTWTKVEPFNDNGKTFLKHSQYRQSLPPTMVRKELFKGFYNSRVHNELNFKLPNL